MHEPLKENGEELPDERFVIDMLRSLRPGEDAEPAPGFYARVMNRIESQQKTSIWNLFSDSLFGRRLSYASLTFLVLLGTYFVSTTEQNQPLVSSMPEAILAGDEQPQAVGSDPQRDRAVVLVNLATYQE